MRLYQRNDVWYIDYSFQGKRIRVKIGKSKEMAELALKEIEVKRAKGEFTGIVELTKIKFKVLAKKYLEFSKANKSENSYRTDKGFVKNLMAQFGEEEIIRITALDVENYQMARKNEVSNITINHEITCLKHMFNKAIDWKYITQNPLSSVKKLKEPPGRVRYLRDDEIIRLLQCCAGHLKPVVITALNTGMRKSEILNLRWQNVDLDRGFLTLRETKNNQVRTLPINKTLYRQLTKLNGKNGSEYVFTYEGRRLKNVKRSFMTALKLANIKDFRFHDLRHTFASRLVMAGENLKTVQELLGHKDIKMTMRYSHLSVAHKQKAVNKLDSLGTMLA